MKKKEKRDIKQHEEDAESGGDTQKTTKTTTRRHKITAKRQNVVPLSYNHNIRHKKDAKQLQRDNKQPPRDQKVTTKRDTKKQ